MQNNKEVVFEFERQELVFTGVHKMSKVMDILYCGSV
ncbi:hypothetical protein MCP1_7230002 [Candidatus Terasakiella magnetica]|nr:hypothetical protein MCP1_7230002 [Candidatus Terasakiella magnetica]